MSGKGPSAKHVKNKVASIWHHFWQETFMVSTSSQVKELLHLVWQTKPQSRDPYNAWRNVTTSTLWASSLWTFSTFCPSNTLNSPLHVQFWQAWWGIYSSKSANKINSSFATIVWNPYVTIYCWLDTKSSFKNPILAWPKSVAVHRPQTYKGSLFVLVEWVVRLYMMILSIHIVVYQTRPCQKYSHFLLPFTIFNIFAIQRYSML